MAEKDLETDNKDLDTSDDTVVGDDSITATDSIEPEVVEDTFEEEPLSDNTDYESSENAIDDDAEGSSLAAKTLKGLLLLVVGAGLALWGAPKLVPYLPQGMAPVAAFLSPGQDAAKADVAALKAQMESELAALHSMDQGVSQETLDAALAEIAAQSQDADTALRDQIASTDSQEIESRLAQLETRLDGLSAEITSVSNGLSGQIVQSGTAVSQDAATQIAAYKAALDGLRAEVDSLSNRQGSLSQRIDEVAATAERKVSEAEEEAAALRAETQERVASAQTQKHLSDTALALDTGAAFQASLTAISDMTGTSIPTDLSDVAEAGTPSLSRLKGRFADAAYDALRADAKARASEGTTSRFAAFLQSQVGTRSLEPRDGDDADAVLSRMDADLQIGNLAKALEHGQALSPAARDAMADWLTDAERLNKAQTALRTLSADLGAE